jgi:hypothetical protein
MSLSKSLIPIRSGLAPTSQTVISLLRTPMPSKPAWKMI